MVANTFSMMFKLRQYVRNIAIRMTKKELENHL